MDAFGFVLWAPLNALVMNVQFICTAVLKLLFLTDLMFYWDIVSHLIMPYGERTVYKYPKEINSFYSCVPIVYVNKISASKVGIC